MNNFILNRILKNMNDLSSLSKKDNKKQKSKEITKPNFWTAEEDKILKEKAEEFKFKNWNSIANFIPGRTSIQCSARYRRIRPGLIKGAWDKDEDNKLLSLYEKYGKNWAAISKEMPHRTGKQIRDRFLNSLDSKFERGKFTEEEDQAIIKYYKIYGNSWAKIAKKLKTRTGDMVKNRFYSSLKKFIFKNKNLLKRKRERQGHNKNKNKNEEINASDKKNNFLVEQKNSTAPIQKYIDKNEKKEIKEKMEKKEVSNNIENVKDCIQENDDINNPKSKPNNISTNVVSYDSNNYSVDNNENKTKHFAIKNNTNETPICSDFNKYLNSKQVLNNIENENQENQNKIDNDNNAAFNLDENSKKNEITNYPEFNYNPKINSDLFMELNDNMNNNFFEINQKDEVDERLDKLKKISKLELEYKQDLKEQLDIIFDLENIINKKLFSVQKELENN